MSRSKRAGGHVVRVTSSGLALLMVGAAAVLWTTGGTGPGDTLAAVLGLAGANVWAAGRAVHFLSDLS